MISNELLGLLVDKRAERAKGDSRLGIKGRHRRVSALEFPQDGLVYTVTCSALGIILVSREYAEYPFT